MNRPAFIEQAKTVEVWIECPDCEGIGFFSSFTRYAGEGMAGEPSTYRCDTCEGRGGHFEECDEGWQA